MGKTSKRRGEKKAAPLSSPSHVGSMSNDDKNDELDRVAALLAADKKAYNAIFDCTNGELLRSIRAYKSISRSPIPTKPPGWKPQTGEEWRQIMDDSLDYFDVMQLTRKDPLEELHLASFREYTMNITQLIKGKTNESYQEDYRAFSGMGNVFDSCIPFPDSQPPPGMTALPLITDRDIRFLKRIFKTHECAIYKAHVALALGFWYKFLDSDMEKGLFMFQSSVQACDAVSARDKQRVISLKPIPMKDGTSMPFQTVGDYLAFVRGNAEAQVKVGRSYVERFMKDGTTYMPGEQCDGCGKQKQQGDKPFLTCSRCKRTYYCSKECQVEHWKRPNDGHKLTCRKKGEFRVGDHAKTLQRFGITPKGLTVVLLEKRQENKWFVGSLYDNDDKCELSEDCLRALAPSEKRFNDAMDKAIFGRNF